MDCALGPHHARPCTRSEMESQAPAQNVCPEANARGQVVGGGESQASAVVSSRLLRPGRAPPGRPSCAVRPVPFPALLSGRV